MEALMSEWSFPKILDMNKFDLCLFVLQGSRHSQEVGLAKNLTQGTVNNK